MNKFRIIPSSLFQFTSRNTLHPPSIGNLRTLRTSVLPRQYISLHTNVPSKSEFIKSGILQRISQIYLKHEISFSICCGVSLGIFLGNQLQSSMTASSQPVNTDEVRPQQDSTESAPLELIVLNKIIKQHALKPDDSIDLNEHLSAADQDRLRFLLSKAFIFVCPDDKEDPSELLSTIISQTTNHLHEDEEFVSDSTPHYFMYLQPLPNETPVETLERQLKVTIGDNKLNGTMSRVLANCNGTIHFIMNLKDIKTVSLLRDRWGGFIMFLMEMQDVHPGKFSQVIIGSAQASYTIRSLSGVHSRLRCATFPALANSTELFDGLFELFPTTDHSELSKYFHKLLVPTIAVWLFVTIRSWFSDIDVAQWLNIPSN